MEIHTPYRTITRDQFLFHGMRNVDRILKDGKSDDQIVRGNFRK